MSVIVIVEHRYARAHRFHEILLTRAAGCMPKPDARFTGNITKHRQGKGFAGLREHAVVGGQRKRSEQEGTASQHPSSQGPAKADHNKHLSVSSEFEKWCVNSRAKYKISRCQSREIQGL